LREVGKALWNARERLDWAKLMQYLKRVQVSSAVRRLGYLMEVLNLKTELRFPSQFKGFRWLDPSSPKKVKGYSKRWGLILNLTEEELLAWRDS
jgi:predicted transcriptional regulator of viral defense system